MEDKKINIAEILKYCPKGMELDCTIWDNVVFEKLDVRSSHHPIIIRRTGSNDSYYTTAHLTKYGQYSDEKDCKCVIYPKGKTTWEGFVPPYKFKDGDILFAKSVYDWIFIYKENGNDVDLYKYVSIPHNCSYKFITYDDNPICRKKEVSEIRLATEEEKKKFFDTIKENGYKWNGETKSLEKLTEFKDGDVAISDLGDIHLLRTKDSSYCAYRIRWTGLSKLDNTITTGVKVTRLATEEEKHILFDSIKANGYRWNEDTKSLEKLINKNKFVIGAIVTNGKIKGKICLRDGDSYVLEDGTHVFFNEVHNWELVPNKFDVTTLKPFKSEVLVRDNVDEVWLPCFFGGICNNDNKYPYRTVGGERWNCCIPYEGNEHLLGTTDDCNEYFKTWEK
jgi:hypothetical protein